MQCVSALLTADLLHQGFEIAQPSIEALLRTSKREGPVFVDLVIIAPYENPAHDDGIGVLYERTVGPAPAERQQWKRDYSAIAQSKAVVSRRMKMDTSAVAALYPALFDSGDTHYEGGAYLAGIPGGASGAEGFIDEGAIRMLLSAVATLVKQKLAAVREAGEVFL